MSARVTATFFGTTVGRLAVGLAAGAALHLEAELSAAIAISIRPWCANRPFSSHVPTVHYWIRSETLGLALSRVRQIQKTRHLFILGRTRVHLDDVSGLGTFLELEVVLADGESPQAGEAEAESILERLGLKGAPRIAGSYVDLG